MNDAELVSLLLRNYRRQAACYEQVLDDARRESDSITRVSGSGDMMASADIIKAHVGLLRRRSGLLDRIREIDAEIEHNKLGWDRRKNEVVSPEAESLKSTINGIRTMLTELIGHDKAFQAFNENVMKQLREQAATE